MLRSEYLCRSCKIPFSKLVDFSEYDEGKVVCPHCGSDDVQMWIGAFYPISSKESA